jgi:hypothetical protein
LNLDQHGVIKLPIPGTRVPNSLSPNNNLHHGGHLQNLPNINQTNRVPVKIQIQPGEILTLIGAIVRIKKVILGEVIAPIKRITLGDNLLLITGVEAEVVIHHKEIMIALKDVSIAARKVIELMIALNQRKKDLLEMEAEVTDLKAALIVDSRVI